MRSTHGTSECVRARPERKHNVCHHIMVGSPSRSKPFDACTPASAVPSMALVPPKSSLLSTPIQLQYTRTHIQRRAHSVRAIIPHPSIALSPHSLMVIHPSYFSSHGTPFERQAYTWPIPFNSHPPLPNPYTNANEFQIDSVRRFMVC